MTQSDRVVRFRCNVVSLVSSGLCRGVRSSCHFEFRGAIVEVSLPQLILIVSGPITSSRVPKADIATRLKVLETNDHVANG